MNLPMRKEVVIVGKANLEVVLQDAAHLNAGQIEDFLTGLVALGFGLENIGGLAPERNDGSIWLNGPGLDVVHAIDVFFVGEFDGGEFLALFC